VGLQQLGPACLQDSPLGYLQDHQEGKDYIMSLVYLKGPTGQIRSVDRSMLVHTLPRFLFSLFNFLNEV
jgi:hypothetical protein